MSAHKHKHNDTTAVGYGQLSSDIIEERPFPNNTTKLIDRRLSDLYGGNCAMEQNAIMKEKVQ